MTNQYHTTFYVGSTNNLKRRLREHITKHDSKSFTARYNLNKLVYYEDFESPEAALKREMFIKGKSRAWKLNLIKTMNPLMVDLNGKWQESDSENSAYR